VVSVAANVVTKSMDITMFVSIGFGLVAVSCGVALAVDHCRRKRR
jgi:ABC-type Mn2+/Zn2+ transport system permease subunit